LVLLAACRQGDDVVAHLKGQDAAVTPTEDAPIPIPDASVEPDVPPPTIIDAEVPRPDVVSDVVVVPPPVDAMPPRMCDPKGPILSVRRINGVTTEACAGQLAAHTFTHALCACGDLNAASLSTVSFASASGETTTVSAGAPVGVAGSYPSARSNIGGSLTVSGTAQTLVSAGLDVQGDLRLAGTGTFYNQLSVARHTWLVSRVGYWGIVKIGGNLYTAPPSGGLQGLGAGPFIGGMSVVMSFTVDDPCRCEDRVDVALIESLGALRNDNAARNIDPAVLSNVTTPLNLALDCGRFRFDSIGGAGQIQLTITGRTAIFVDSNVALSDSFQLVLGPDAELDWFIRGSLSLGGAKIGDPNRPSATRIYVAGGDTDIVVSEQVGANIYAPNSNVNFPLTVLGVTGSVYGKNLSMLGGGIVRYDRSILNAGDKCGQPATCDKCDSCNSGAACVNGVCQQCTEDDDCCSPLVCAKGSCQPLLFQ
jgi:hypothetical protein